MSKHKKIDNRTLSRGDIDKFKEWDKIVAENIDSWIASFCKMVSEHKNLDMSFNEFLELSMFKIEFKDMIEEAVVEYKKDTEETDIDYDSFAYSLLQSAKSETEALINAQEGIA